MKSEIHHEVFVILILALVVKTFLAITGKMNFFSLTWNQTQQGFVPKELLTNKNYTPTPEDPLQELNTAFGG